MPVILITNNTLATRAGTEIYVRDIAVALLGRGWQPVACSNVHGEIAEELRGCSVPVIDDPRKMHAAPDLIHAHHHLDAMAAIAAWPGVPVIAFCHGWAPWEETPFRHPQIVKYVAVDQLCLERLVIEHGIPAEDVELLPNFVDLHRFRPRTEATPQFPQRALVFSNVAHAGLPAVNAIREACARLGISLEVVGKAFGNPTALPQARLAEADLVFAKGRCALEALAVGCGVVVFDFTGLADLVTRENYEHYRRLNFGFRLMATGLSDPTADDIVVKIKRWNADDIASVSARVRQECGIGQAMDRLAALYHRALLRSVASDKAALHASSIAMAGYLLDLGIAFKKFNEKYAAAATSQAELNHLRWTCAALNEHISQLKASQSELTHLRCTCAALNEHISQLKASQSELTHLQMTGAALNEQLKDQEAAHQQNAACQARTIAELQQRLKRFAGVRRFMPRWLATRNT